MNQLFKVKTFAIVGAFLFTIFVVWCPQSMATEAASEDIQHLAMGTVGDTPQDVSKAPQENAQTLMIHLGTAHFDPLDQQPAQISGLSTIQTYTEETAGYYIVQFDGPIQPDWKTTLKQAGVEIFDYVPEYAFIVRMPSATATSVRAMAHVRWVGIFQPLYRVSQSAVDMMYATTSEEAAEPVTLRVNIFPGESPEQMESLIQSLGGIVEEKSSTELKTTFKIKIPADKIKELAEINGIKWVEPVPQWKLFNNNSTDVMNVRAPRNTKGLYGSGQTVGIADTGLDQGSVNPNMLHDDFENGSGATRVLAIIDTAGDGDTSDTNGHGTHVAGSVLGNGRMSGSDPVSSNFPDTCFAGIAPKANLVFQASWDTSVDPPALNNPTDLNNLFRVARSAGADLHTNSWGASLAGQYTSTSQDVDEYMWNNKSFFIQFSAGNSGVDMDADGVIDLYSIGSPATAKNCLTVGASEGDRPSGAGYDMAWGTFHPYNFSAAPIASDHVSDNDRGIAAFSSRGPTLDGRHKPDIVAPGTNILSTRSSVGGNIWGAYPANSNYIWAGGTSMATPLTAGAAALMREYLVSKKGFSPPSAALIKAALINSAEDITPGQYGFGSDQEIPDSPVPNNVEGWGRLNLGDGVFPETPANILYYDHTAGLDTGEYNEYTINVTDTGAPLKINLVWTDYPGTPAAQGGLVNDLDLKVMDTNDVAHYPNHASKKSSLSTMNYNSGVNLSASTNNKRAIRFTPAAYPAFVESTTFNFINNAPVGTNVDVVVYDDDDTNGLPGTELFRKTLAYVPTGYVSVGIQGVVINNGDFYIAIEKSSSIQAIVIDNDGNPTNRSYWHNGLEWGLSSYTAYIRANIRTAAYSTSFDRVNNTLGITFDSPVVGNYTIRVAGFNVPQGPQPYALVASGHIQATQAGVLQFESGNFSVGENDGAATITVVRTGGTEGNVSLNYATSNGTATAGSDYTTASGTLNWSSGDDSKKRFTIPISDDNTIESSETIILTLSNPSGGAALGSNDTAILTINDNDSAKEVPVEPGGGGGGGGCFVDMLLY